MLNALIGAFAHVLGPVRLGAGIGRRNGRVLRSIPPWQRHAWNLRLKRELQPVKVSPVPWQEKRVVVLTPAEWHAMPAGEIVEPRLSFNARACLTACRKSPSYCALRESILLRTLRRTGAAFGAGRAVMVLGLSSQLPARNDLCRYSRARPPPCMRWRGPCLATSYLVNQLPGFPGATGRPLVPCTRDPVPVSRSLAPSPGVSPGSGARFQR